MIEYERATCEVVTQRGNGIKRTQHLYAYLEEHTAWHGIKPVGIEPDVLPGTAHGRLNS